MAEVTRSQSRYATWLVEGLESAADRTIASPALMGIGDNLIGFGGGQPAAELYPLQALERAFSRAILEDGRSVLPYGPSEGLPALREIVAERLSRRGIQVGAENVLVLSGSLQGLHLVGRITLDHGDTIVTEAPTFMGALAAWEHQQPRYLTIPVDEHGMLTHALDTALSKTERRPRFVYLLPTFQNPSGVSLSLDRRRHLLEIAREHDLFIIEDDPYGEFWFDEGSGPIPPLRSLPGSEERVIYLGTFSKILAPGIRLGYAVASTEVIDLLARAKRGVDFHTDGLLQQAVVHLIRDGDFDLEAHVVAGRTLYKQRRDVMLDSLEGTFSAETRWTRPAGGFFLWVDLPADVSGDAVTVAALAAGVAVYPGSIFYPNGDGGTSGLRLSFSDASPANIREGIQRLKRGVDAVGQMKALLLTNEYPPNVYGGAGVHVEFLSRELARLMDVEVRCFGDQHVDDGRLRVRGYAEPQGMTAPEYLRPVFGAMGRDVAWAATDVLADVVHCHTWYAHLGGLLVRQGYGVPLAITVHSLEPLRPWKREQLRGGYDLSCWVEQTALAMADAVIAVSNGTRDDILRVTDARPERVHVIYNGIDTSIYRPVAATDALERYGIDPGQPIVLFVGRITRQKGIIHLVRAIPRLDPAAQVVLCAGAPDTPAIAAEMEQAVADAQRQRSGVIWIQEMLPREAVIQLYTHATVFCCPSIYEPFGIINLEAMACGTPVAASAVGGIPEVVVDGETGLLVPLEQQTDSPFEPLDPPRFSADLASAVNRLLGDPGLRGRMARAGRERVERAFAWPAIAQQTADLYARIRLESPRGPPPPAAERL